MPGKEKVQYNFSISRRKVDFSLIRQSKVTYCIAFLENNFCCGSSYLSPHSNIEAVYLKIFKTHALLDIINNLEFSNLKYTFVSYAYLIQFKKSSCSTFWVPCIVLGSIHLRQA